MSLGTSFNLSPNTATNVDTNEVVFTLRAADLDGSEFSVAGLTPPLAKELSFKHDVGKAGEARHLIRYDQVLADSFGVAATGSVYLNIVRPVNSAFTDAVIIAMVNSLIDFLTAGGANVNVVHVLNNET